MANTQYKLSILIGVLDKASAPFRRMAEHVDRLADRAEQASKRTTRLGDGLRRVGSSLSRIGRAAGLRRIADAATKASQRIGALGGHVARLGAGIGALGGGAAYGFKRLFLDVGVQFENLEMRMKAAFGGDGVAGKRALEWVSDFARTVPFELTQMTDAFIKLRNFGIDPTNGSLQAIVDQAAKSGGDLQKLEAITLALGQAWTKGKLQGEEALQLIESGGVRVWELLSRRTGLAADQLQDLAEKGKLGRGAIQMLIDEMGKDAAGASAEMAKGWQGMLSMLADAWSRFANMVMKSGAFEYLKFHLKKILVHLEYLENKGTLKKWAESLGRNMLQAFREIWAGLKKLWSGLQWLEEKLGGWDKVLVAVAAVLTGPLVASLVTATAAVVQLGVALMATPVGWILGAIALIAGAVYLIYRNWDSIAAWFTDKRDALYAVFDQIVDGAAEAVGAFFTKVGEIAGAIGDYFAGIDLSEAGGRIIGSLWDGLKASWARVADWFSGVGDKISSWLPSWLGGEDDAASAGNDGPRAAGSTGAARVMQRAAAQGTLAPGRQTVRTEVHIKADNLPPGMAVSTPKGEADRTDVDLGFSRAGGW